MTDDDDRAEVFAATPIGAFGVIGLLIVLVYLAITLTREHNCERAHCPAGASPRWIKNACVCVP